MPIERKIKCDVPDCECSTIEKDFGSGFEGGWSSINGVKWNGVINPILCPGHVHVVMEFLDRIKGAPVIT